MKPTRSANSTETSRRSAAGGSLGGVGASRRPSGLPHSPQKRTPASFGAPHDGHARASGEPHSPQNLRPAVLSAPHAVQALIP